jgi:methyltransferase (TIGR00027 family)
MLRAAHLLRDSKPHILRDELAAPLAGFNDEASLNGALDSFAKEVAHISSEAIAQAWLQIGRLSIAMRSRYAEDALTKALERGVSQYVVLGAGFDSFAYRRRDLAERVRVFEVDHPDTQEMKRARLTQIQVPSAANVTYVSVDFEKQPSIITPLQAMGYRHDAPALFSWLGVVWYLSDAAIERTFREIAATAPGSEIVLDYLVPESMMDERCRQIVQIAERTAASRGEHGGRSFEPARMVEMLRLAGFAYVQDLGARELNVRYLSSRSDGLQIPEMMRLVSAHV